MKKVIYYFPLVFGLIISATSCNNDDDPVPRVLWLSRVEENGVTALELIFDTQGKLTRLNDFADGDFSSYVFFDYDNKGIKESRRYNADDDVLENRSVFTRNNLGQVTSVENYTAQSNFAAVISKSTFVYDASGRVLRKQYIFEGNVVYFLQEFTYDGNGQLIKDQWTYNPDQLNEYIGSITEYVPKNASVSDHWSDSYLLLDVSGLESYVLEIFASSIHHTNFNGDGKILSEHKIDVTSQEFNSDGYLTRQMMTRKNLSGKEPDVIREMTYEYTE